MTIRISKDPAAIALQERWERLRGHKRIISRVKLLVEWEQGGAKEHANAVTVDVSHSGCMAVVGADLPLHNRVHFSLGNSSELFRGFGNRACGIRTFRPPGTSAKCRPS